jgi:hypothetical protein
VILSREIEKMKECIIEAGDLLDIAPAKVYDERTGKLWCDVGGAIITQDGREVPLCQYVEYLSKFKASLCDGTVTTIREQVAGVDDAVAVRVEIRGGDGNVDMAYRLNLETMEVGRVA